MIIVHKLYINIKSSARCASLKPQKQGAAEAPSKRTFEIEPRLYVPIPKQKQTASRINRNMQSSRVYMRKSRTKNKQHHGLTIIVIMPHAQKKETEPRAYAQIPKQKQTASRMFWTPTTGDGGLSTRCSRHRPRWPNRLVLPFYMRVRLACTSCIEYSIQRSIIILSSIAANEKFCQKCVSACKESLQVA